MITEINNETEYAGVKSKEYSKLVQELPDGIVLIWDEKSGYIIPNREMYKIKNLEEDIALIKEAYKENTDINPKEN